MTWSSGAGITSQALESGLPALTPVNAPPGSALLAGTLAIVSV